MLADKSIFFLSLFLVLAGCSGKDRITPAVGPITESVYASGEVKAENQYTVYPEVTGFVESIEVEAGDTVSKGSPLFFIENTASELSTEGARIELEQSREEFRDVRELQLQVDQARKQFQEDSLLYERQKRVWEKGVGTKVELEQRRLAFQGSKANYLSALNNLKQVKNQLALQQQQAETNLRIQQEMEGDYTVQSEIEGIVYRVFPEPGEAVSPQDPLAILGKPGKYFLEMQVDEYDIVRVKTGQKAFVTLDSYEDTVFEAVVSEIDPILDKETGSFRIEAEFINPPPRLFPNLTAEANVLIRKKENALIIPREYLVDETYVLTKPDEKKKVEVGLTSYEYAEIVSGITRDQVIYKPE